MGLRLLRSSRWRSGRYAVHRAHGVRYGVADLRGPSPEALSESFADALGDVEEPKVGGVLGVEHEYQIRHLRKSFDFNAKIHELELGIRHLDPADPNAYPLDSGSVLTCDGSEAEIALAPIPVIPGAAGEASAVATRERLRLEASLGPDFEAAGYSTHLSIWTPPEDTERVARVIVSRFAPAIMLLFDRAESPGLLVRPRNYRTELGGEYISGASLAAAGVFTVGCVRSARLITNGSLVGPPIIQSSVVPTPERFGWYVDRTAFGGDLYAGGRDAQLIDQRGRSVTAQAQLEAAWAAARPTIDSSFNAAELGLVDALVAGERPLPLEGQAAASPEGITTDLLPDRDRFGPLANPRRRHFELAPVMVTWEVSIFLMADLGRRHRSFVVVPRPLLGRFMRLLESGELDSILGAYLIAPPTGRLVTSRHQTLVAGLHDEIPARVSLLNPERDPDRLAIFRTR